MNATDTRSEQNITVKNLVVGDELVYLDGNQIVTKIEKGIDLNFHWVYDIYVEGIATPRTQPGKAPVTVLR